MVRAYNFFKEILRKTRREDRRYTGGTRPEGGGIRLSEQQSIAQNLDEKECRGTGSNCRHLVFQTSALPLSYLGITHILYQSCGGFSNLDYLRSTFARVLATRCIVLQTYATLNLRPYLASNLKTGSILRERCENIKIVACSATIFVNTPSSVLTGHLPPHGEDAHFNAPSTWRERVARSAG